MKKQLWATTAAALALLAGARAGGMLAQTANARAGVPAGQVSILDANQIVRELALLSPNPYMRDTVTADRDEDWLIDARGMSFSVKVRGPVEQRWTGRLEPTKDGRATAAFDDEAGLSRGWMAPADATLNLDEAMSCLREMGDRMPEMGLVSQVCALMKDAQLKVDLTTGVVTGTARQGTGNYSWRINLKERTFHLSATLVDFGPHLSGRFGWDKDRKWTAWPIRTGTHGMRGISENVAIPLLSYGRNAIAASSSALADHAAAAANDANGDSYWQPAADDARASWTVDLERVIDVRYVRLKFARPGRYGLVIDLSDDQKTWRRMADKPIPNEGTVGPSGRPIVPSPVTEVEVLQAAGKTGRYVRLQFQPPWKDQPIQLTQVEIRGEPTKKLAEGN